MKVSFVAAIAACTLGCLSQANAAPIAYTLTPDVPGFPIGLDSYTVAATFDWDTSTNLESNVDITLTGTGSYAGTYTSTPDIISAVQTEVTDNDDVCGEMGIDAVCLRFADAVGSVVPDSLVVVASGDQAPDLNAPATGLLDVSNGAEAVLSSSITTSPVPEPFTLSLFGAGLAGAAALRRRKKAKA